MHVMGRTGTLALTEQSRLCSDVFFAIGEDDEVEVEEEVEWDEPMVSVRDLDWKRDGSLGYFIVLDEDSLGEEDGSIEDFWGFWWMGGRVVIYSRSRSGLGGVSMHRVR
jgi:hypothetical protein